MESGDPTLLRQIVTSLLNGNRIFLTGAAGTGKTYLVKRIARAIAEKQKLVRVTASTGIASSLLFDEIDKQDSLFIQGPSTLHSAAMLPWSSEKDTKNLRTRGRQLLAGADVIIVDEISMLDRETFDRFLDRVHYYTGILVVGDFFQLPPVHENVDGGPDFAFLSKDFEKCGIVELTKNYRQDEKAFLAFLERLRLGENDRMFFASVSSEFDLQHPVLFGTRREAHHHNVCEMGKINIKSYWCKCRVEVGNHEKALKWFATYARAVQTLEVKEGMRVLCIQNHAKLVNGDLGTIIKIAREDWEGYGPAWVEVEFDRVGKYRLPRYKFKKKKWTKNREEIVFAVQQFPLIPAYGLTVHKAQGMSLDIVNVDGRKVNFAAGQVYVAISRCRTRAGLRVKNSNMFEAFTRESVEAYYRQAQRF